MTGKPVGGPSGMRGGGASAASTAPAVLFGSGLEPVIKGSASLTERLDEITGDVRVTVATPTRSGLTLQEQRGLLDPKTLDLFRPDEDGQDDAVERLTRRGFRIIRRGRFSITVGAPAALVSETIGQPMVVQARARRSTERATQDFAASFEAPYPQDLFLSPRESLSIRARGEPTIDHFVFTPPPLYFGPPQPDPPAHSFHAVDEARIRTLLNVPSSLTGAGIRVALVDTGFYPHPYYAKRGYAFEPVPTPSAPAPHIDDFGHGTAVAFNVFAVAPGVQLLGFKQTDPPQDALEDAADMQADIISCSWGYDREEVFPILQASILSIIAEGRVLLFAAGNGHYAWPGSEPDVLSVGGVYWNPESLLEASNYASGYMSSMFPNRRVPDVCGLCGTRPKAIYIMMPTQPANTMDVANGGPDFPWQDQGTGDDGWVGASGTSSATPQVAGVVALMLQKARTEGVSLAPADIRRLLEETAISVQSGRNAMGIPAIGQPNTATGFGLVNAAAALARIPAGTS